MTIERQQKGTTQLSVNRLFMVPVPVPSLSLGQSGGATEQPGLCSCSWNRLLHPASPSHKAYPRSGSGASPPRTALGCCRGVAHLSGLLALEQLNLSENSAVRDSGLAGLSRLTRLASLDLSYTSEWRLPVTSDWRALRLQQQPVHADACDRDSHVTCVHPVVPAPMTSLCCEALRHDNWSICLVESARWAVLRVRSATMPKLDPFSSHQPCKHTCSIDSRPAAGVSDAGLQAIAALSGLTHRNTA